MRQGLPAIVVQQGGRIVANGTRELPITFTASRPFDYSSQNVTTDHRKNHTVELGWRGKWGGIVLLGRAPIAEGFEHHVEGLEGDEGRFGGDLPDDDSGVLRYVRIWHAGSTLSADNELNGLTLAGVGRGTVVSFVEVAFSLDDGFEFFGGTVNVDHLASLFVGDDAFDVDAGYQGSGQFLFTLMGDRADHGIEVDAFNGSSPRSHPVFYSITAVGVPTVSHGQPLILTRNGAAGQYGNAVLAFGGGPGAEVGSCNLGSIVQSLPGAAGGGAAALDVDTLYFSSRNLATPCNDVVRTCDVRVEHACVAGHMSVLPSSAYPDALDATTSEHIALWCAGCEAHAQGGDGGHGGHEGGRRANESHTSWRCLLDGVACDQLDFAPGAADDECMGPVDVPPAAFTPVTCRGAFGTPGDNWLAGWSILYEEAYQATPWWPAGPPIVPPPAPPLASPLGSIGSESSGGAARLPGWAILLMGTSIFAALLLVVVVYMVVVYRDDIRALRRSKLGVRSARERHTDASNGLPMVTASLAARRDDAPDDPPEVAATETGAGEALAGVKVTPPAESAPVLTRLAVHQLDGDCDMRPSGSTDGEELSTTSNSSSLGSFGPTIFESVKAMKKYKDFHATRVLGRGSSGVAVLLADAQTGERVVSKRIFVDSMGLEEIEKVENEVVILKQLSHSSPHIVSYLDSVHVGGTICLIMEYADGGNLQRIIRAHLSAGRTISSVAAHIWLWQLASAVRVVHESHLLHRDIKTTNVFLTAAGAIKLGDFGLARRIDPGVDLAETACGTPYYLSPEKVGGKPYGRQSDMWALGIVLYEVLALRRPFRGATLAGLIHEIQACAVDEAPLTAAGHSPQLATLASARKLLHPDPTLRTTGAELTAYLRKHSAASGVSEAQLAKGDHGDCRAAVKLGQSFAEPRAHQQEAEQQEAPPQQQVPHEAPQQRHHHHHHRDEQQPAGKPARVS